MLIRPSSTITSISHNKTTVSSFTLFYNFTQAFLPIKETWKPIYYVWSSKDGGDTDCGFVFGYQQFPTKASPPSSRTYFNNENGDDTFLRNVDNDLHSSKTSQPKHHDT